MAITSVSALAVTNAIALLDGTREYTVDYLVESNSANDSLVSAMTASGIPSQGVDTFTFGTDFDTYAVAGDITGRPQNTDQDHHRSWIVTVTFSNRTQRLVEPNRIDDPLNEPAVLGGSFVTAREPVIKTSTGRDYKNSAGDYFEGDEKDASRMSLTITKNYSQLDLTNIQSCMHSVNSATFFTQSARKWKLSRARWNREFYGGTSTGGSEFAYYRVTYEFELNPDTWDYEPVDRGFFYKTTDGDKVNYPDKNGMPLNRPGPLDGSGGILASTADLVYFDATSGSLESFKVYDSKNFSTLGIPTSSTGIV